MLNLIYPLLALAIILAAVKFAPPITKSANLSGTRNASNNLIMIKMRKNLGQWASAIWAQEYYEIKLKKRHLIKALTRNKKFLQDMEIMGHEIETLVATELGADESRYRIAEAKALTRYKQFKGVSQDDIHARMIAVRKDALKFIAQNASKIKSAQKYE